MSRFTFESTFPDGSPRLFAGTYRPPFNGGKIVLHPDMPKEPLTGHFYVTLQQLHDAWLRGEFDHALYREEDS